MITVTIREARKELAALIAKTVSNNEETIIASENGSVVLIDEREWESIKETLRLFSDKKSLRALLEGHERRDKGKSPSGKTPDRVFPDV